MVSDDTLSVLVLVDYDNLREDHKRSGILSLITKALSHLPKSISATLGTCEVRIYGGWYEEALMTHLAQDVSIRIQEEFPAIIKIPLSEGRLIQFRTNAELAFALYQEPSHHLFNTFRKKAVPSNIRFAKPLDVGCTNSSCILHLAKKLLQKNKCPIDTCSTTSSELVYRHEQKIVDTMLTCDLIYASQSNSNIHIMLVSDDDDFLPPIRTALLNGSQIYRLHPKHRLQIQQQTGIGTRLTELEL